MVFNHKPSILGPIVMIFAIMTFCLAGEVYSQDEPGEYSICLKKPFRSAVTRHGLFGNPKNDITVKWSISLQDEPQENSVFDRYVISCSKDSTFPYENTIREIVSIDSAVFRSLDARNAYYFKMAAFVGDKDEPGAISIPCISDGIEIPPNWTNLSPAYLTLSIPKWIGNYNMAIQALEKTSFMGRLAFEVISLFLYIGLIAWYFKTRRILRATQVFFVDKEINKMNECDKIPGELTTYGLPLKMVPLLTQLAKGRLSRVYYYGHKRFGRMEKIYWWERLVKKRQSSPGDKLFKDIPSFKILKAISHDFKKQSDLKDALEVQIAAEEEDLRKRSFIDILWGLGVTAPLVGLFGTVTGISQSFRTISVSSPDDASLMSNLSGGIFEALFTTICGLTVGIIFMLAFYYYNYKMDRIHAIWVTFAASYLDIYNREMNGISASTSSPTPTPPPPPPTSSGN